MAYLISKFDLPIIQNRLLIIDKTFYLLISFDIFVLLYPPDLSNNINGINTRFICPAVFSL